MTQNNLRGTHLRNRKMDLTPGLIYGSEKLAKKYITATKNSIYGKTIMAGEFELFSEFEEVFRGCINEADGYIDLGPGDGLKSKQLLSLRRKPINSYEAVDMQPYFLELAKKTIGGLAQKIHLTQSTFEDWLGAHNTYGTKFTYLGATFANFAPHTILPMMRERIGRSDDMYLSCGRFTSVDQHLAEYPLEKMEPLLDSFRMNHGFSKKNTDATVQFNSESNAVEVGVKLKDATDEFAKGDFVVALQSRKLLPAEFKQDVEQYFEGDFFVNDRMTGFLGRRKVALGGANMFQTMSEYTHSREKEW